MIGILSVVAGALLATTLTPQAATGQPLRAPSGPAAYAPDASEAATRAYWTPERMRAADSIPPDAVADGIPPGDAAVRSAPAGDEERPGGVPWTLGAEPVRNVGKLFLTIRPAKEGGPERDASCTAAVVRSGNRSVVATAAHCVYLNAAGGWMKRMIFVPAYDKGEAPYGSYVAKSGGVDAAWQSGEDHEADFAFLLLGPDEQGRRVEDVTGARRAVFEPVAGEKTALGYPVDKPYDGETLQYCSGPVTAITDERLKGGEQLAPCRMTHGASGGPWYARTPEGEDVQVAVTSSRPKEPAFENAAWGAVFTAKARTLFEDVGRAGG
ncbi:trypsin-like serine peptidase [Streptomyces indicus]|uniref:V8-like Glu-specific endopeptidase n=1 Tax=Streptomyces indicus TaxID=417292 RepID=A0A1G9BG63_9ACTN|nr:trypsin-like peptidase domain-containing protein [Streptomyces indicus]SDK38190.1 hypothetical protein SAMN05421806_10730 [Streptomyces indicus]